MRLLFVHNLPPWNPRSGGGQRVQHEIACRAAAAGHDVRALFVGEGAPPPGWTPPYRWIGIPERRRLVANVAGMALGAFGLVREWTPDAVQASAPEGAGVVPVLPRGVGLVATSHHPDPPDLTRMPRLRTAPFAALRAARRLQAALLERFVIERAHVIVATSRWGAEMMRSRGYARGDRPIEVVHNGVDPAWLAPPSDGDGPAGRDGILFVGRLSPEKGVTTLLDALASMGPDARLLLVGTGPSGEELEGVARQRGLGARAVFLGPKQPPEIRTLMAGARALVLPSLAENFPLVLLEAMAAGLPVVATSVGGIPEIVRDGDTGLVVPPRDAAALARALTRVANDDLLWRRLARAGRVAVESLTWDRVWQRLEPWFEEAARRALASR